MIQSFNTSVKQKLFTDEFRSPVSASSASQGILLALEKTTGIIHLGGKERISRYDFGVMLAEVGNFDKRLIVPKLQQEIKLTAPRPPDVSLNSLKAFILGYSTDNIRNALAKLSCLSA
jgi:dTDP-4-dehydrorhamnose reductase